MKKISNFIVKNCYVIFAIFVTLAGVCGILASRVKINHDIYSYMPEDSETSRGLAIMDDEFDYSSTSDYQVMIKNLSESERFEVKAYLESVEKIDSVEYDSSETYNQVVEEDNGNIVRRLSTSEVSELGGGVADTGAASGTTFATYSLFKATVSAPSDSDEAATLYSEVHEHFQELGYEFWEGGSVYNSNGSVLKIWVILLAVASAMVILILMSESFVEPWLYLFSILIAVLLNKGTNLIFPSVSHITDSIAAILQMALSMDYSIMLAERYRQEKKKLLTDTAKTALAKAAISDVEHAKYLATLTKGASVRGAEATEKPLTRRALNRKAMARALRYSFGAISSSSVTTVVGLIVLVCMSFTIGRDMGLVLSKGVILSLLSIFTTLPALLLLFDRAIERTHKKTLKLKMDLIGKQSFHLRKLAIPAFAAIFIGAFFLKGSVNIDYTASQNDHIKDVFDPVNQSALVYDKSVDATVTEFCQNYENHPDVVRILCYGNTIGEPEKYDEIVTKINDLKDMAGSGFGGGSDSTDAGSKKTTSDDSEKATSNDGEKTTGGDSEAMDSTGEKGATTDDASDGKFEAEDYLIKVLYYHYYRAEGTHTMTLPEFITFVQTEIIPSERFADEVTAKTASDVDRLAKFILPEEAAQLRSKSEIARILGVSESNLDELFTLYLSEYPTGVKLTEYQFADFVTREILTNSEYSSMVSSSQKADLAKLLKLSNPSVTNSKMTASQLAELFRLSESDVDQLLTYYYYLEHEEPTVAFSPAELVDYAKNSERISSELRTALVEKAAEQGLAEEELDEIIAEVKVAVEEAQEKLEKLKAEAEAVIAELPEEDQEIINEIIAEAKDKVDEVLNAPRSYDDYAKLAGEIEDVYAETIEKLGDFAIILELPEAIDLSPYLGKLKQVYRLYEAEKATVSLSPKEFINFLLDHADDEMLEGALTDESRSQLTLAKYIVDYQEKAFSAYELADAFGLDLEKIELVYALYDYRYVTKDLKMSLETLVDFIMKKVIPNETYAAKLDAEQRRMLTTISGLMSTRAVQYNSNALYRALLPLSSQIDSDQLFLLYLYHGSLYDYNESWTLTIEQFVAFLNDRILPDERFSPRIDDETRQNIIDGQQTLADARELLIGEKHMRALIETSLPAEGTETFGFIAGVKSDLADSETWATVKEAIEKSDSGNSSASFAKSAQAKALTANSDYYLIGDSAMAYEMSQTFSSEMDFITILTMVSIFVVVALTFKSIFIPLLLVLVIQSAVYINMAYMSLTGMNVYFIALIIVQAILMGATIDYAILYTSYYLESRNYLKLGVKEALITAYNKSIHAILTSASILVIVTAIVGVLASAIAGKICQSISTGTLCATLIILIILPALLASFDRLIVKKKE